MSVADLMFRADLAAANPTGEARQFRRTMACNPGGWYKDKETGVEYYIKVNSTELHTRLENFANRVYGALGVPAGNSHLVVIPEGETQHLAIASVKVSGARNSNAEELRTHPDVIENFVLDAFLNNRDSVGEFFDNVVIGTDKRAYRIDNGSVAMFSATGKPRDFFSYEIPAIRTMRAGHESGQVFGGISDTQVALQAGRLALRLNYNLFDSALYVSGVSGQVRITLLDALMGRIEVLRNLAAG